MAKLFSNCCLKIFKKAFLVPNLGNLFLREILQLDKFEGANFKHNNIILKFQSKNTKTRHLWPQFSGVLHLYQTLQQEKFEDFDFKYEWQ